MINFMQVNKKSRKTNLKRKNSILKNIVNEDEIDLIKTLNLRPS